MTESTRYYATITHHSISRARVVDVGNDLTAAKRNATKEFGGDFNDYLLVIFDRQDPSAHCGQHVAARRLGEKRWN